MYSLNRQERLRALALTCKRNGVDPSQNRFAGVIRSIDVTYMHVTVAVASQDTEELIVAYKGDQWRNIIGEEAPVEKAKQLPVLNPIVTRTTLKEELAKIQSANSHVEIKHLPTYISTQKDYISDDDLIKTLYQKARREASNDNVGRILLSDARDVADNKHLTIQEIIVLWRKTYPAIEVEQRTGNVILVYWDGKNSLRNIRSTRSPIIRTDNVLAADKDNIFEAEKNVDPDEYPANKENFTVGETYEETEEE